MVYRRREYKSRETSRGSGGQGRDYVMARVVSGSFACSSFLGRFCFYYLAFISYPFLHKSSTFSKLCQQTLEATMSQIAIGIKSVNEIEMRTEQSERTEEGQNPNLPPPRKVRLVPHSPDIISHIIV